MKKGKEWHFGMKIHVGADVDSGAVHTVEVTAANEADINVLPKLLRDEDKVILGDAGSDEYKRESQQFGFIRTRYRRLMKNAVQVIMLMGLVNLYLLRRRLLAIWRRESPSKYPQW